MRIILIGQGRMGRRVADLACDYNCVVTGLVDSQSVLREGDSRLEGVDVAIDFSQASAVKANTVLLARRGINIVIGTTGWSMDEEAVRQIVADGGIGVVVAPNFSVGAVLFEAMVAYGAKLFAGQNQFGAYLHEVHHGGKKDAPSGTALGLKQTMETMGFNRGINVSYTRVGYVPGTHTVGFDGPTETVKLIHTVRDRSTFAQGALVAANWIQGRRGWFTMKEVLGCS